MEYGGGLEVQNCCSGFGSLSSETTEADFIDELLVEGCWVETTENLCGGVVGDPSSQSHTQQPHYLTNEQQQQQIMLNNIQQDENCVVGKRWWIGARAGPSSSVKDRLVVAVGYLKEYTKNTNVLIQIWVPPRRSGSGLVPHYHHDPNPSPNVKVRFFRSHEYPGVVQQYDVRGCLALPVFERGSGTCLGVLEIPIITDQNIIPQLLSDDDQQAVDFRSYQNLMPPSVKVFDELYQAAVSEIVEVLTSVCRTHNLPLAMTWAPCIQQGKCGCTAHSSNYVHCLSTLDSACFVADLDILRFQEACSEYHLFRGQGIVGTAFTTAKPCFAIDITAFSKAEYPLSHHAKMFGLHAAVAIPLRSVYTGSADFVLEFFLPKDCHDTQEQRHMLNSLSMFVQQACRSLHVVTEDEYTLPLSKDIHKLLFASPSPSPSQVEPSSWIAHMMEAQQKGKAGVSVSLEYQLEEPKEEFRVTTNWDAGSNEQATTTQVEQSSGSRSRASTVEEESYSFTARRSSSGGARKSGEKRRTKAEKTISLPVLRQYFAGSLKDAAKSIGVCPTTLKRICRQHGITRWPSRKIKKVGHSLKKLQLVIDSVQGAEGAIQIGSFYSSFPELCSADHFSATGPSAEDSSRNAFMYGHGGDACSQTFGPTIINTATANNNNNVLMTESPDHALLNIAQITQEDTKHFTRSKGHQMSETSGWKSRDSRGAAFRVKATFVDENIRFSLQPNWGFTDLQHEIARRFNLNDLSNIDLKYLDDEGEWVVLACDADVEECKDLHRSSQSRTIRLALFQASTTSPS